MKRKPKLFRMKEFYFAILAIVAAVICTYFTVYGEDMSAEKIAIMWSTVGVFGLIYGRLLQLRKKYLDTITFVTKDRIIVVAKKFNVLGEDFSKIVEETIAGWDKAIGNGFDSRKALRDTTVIFRKFPVSHYTKEGKLAGYTIGKHVVVGFKKRLRGTALGHELGHVIHQEWKGYTSEVESHKFMKEHNLN